MVKFFIEIPGERSAEQIVPQGRYTAGSSPDANFYFPSPGVSGTHCTFTIDGNSVTVEDAGSTNGTFVDGKMISASAKAFEGSFVMIGTVKMTVISGEKRPNEKASEPAVRRAAPVSRAGILAAVSASVQDEGGVPVLAVSGVPRKARGFVNEIKKRAHAELLQRLNVKRMVLSGADGEGELADKAKEAIHSIMKSLSVPLPDGVTCEMIETELYHEAIGLGPLEDLIAMEDITEIMVNGHDHVYVEHKGVLYRTDLAFADDNQVLSAIERIVAPLGRRIDESSPMVDARLKDGSRVNAIIPPLALDGPSITIRKFAKTPLKIGDLIRFGSITQEIADFLDLCVKLRKNIIISGGTGSGKTTLLNILSGFLPDRERIVTIEDAAELQLRQEHVVRLEARPPNIEGKGEISIRDLVKNSLRMRPDRIVIGECRGGEALDMLQAMNTGHDGSLTTIHANSPRDALARLETLVLMSGFDLPLRAIREQIASAIAIVVQISRTKDGSRKVECVSEITKMEGDVITMQDLFIFKQEGWTSDGKMKGSFRATGNVPTFIDEIRRAGLKFDISIFTPQDGRGDVEDV